MRAFGRAFFTLLLLVLLPACTGRRSRRGFVPSPVGTSMPTTTPSPRPTSSATEIPTTIPSPTSTTIPFTISANAEPRLVPLRTLADHTEGVTSLAFSPDGIWLASGSADDIVRLWEAATGQLAVELVGHRDDVRSVSFSPHGDRLASASEDGTVRIWSVPEGDLLDTIDALLEHIFRVSFSPDGNLLALAGNRCVVEIRDARHGILLRTLTRPGCTDRSGWATSWGLAFAPLGSSLAAGEGRPCCGGSLHLWKLGIEVASQRLPHQGSAVTDLAFSPDGRILAVASSLAAIRLVSMEAKEVFAILEGHDYAVNALGFSPQGDLLASGSRDQTVRIWELAEGRTIQILEGHQGSVTSVAFSPDGSLLASGAEDGTVVLWGIEDARAQGDPDP